MDGPLRQSRYTGMSRHIATNLSRFKMVLDTRSFDWLVRSESKYDWLRAPGVKNHRQHQFETQTQSHFLGVSDLESCFIND